MKTSEGGGSVKKYVMRVDVEQRGCGGRVRCYFVERATTRQQAELNADRKSVV